MLCIIQFIKLKSFSTKISGMADPERLFAKGVAKGFETVLGYYPEYKEKHFVGNSIRISLCGVSVLLAINYAIYHDWLGFGLDLFGYGVLRFYPRVLGYKSGHYPE